jgi:broad specificity phosphatase PhoE
VQVSTAARLLVGKGKIIDPDRLREVLVSPRERAQQTFDLLLGQEYKDKALVEHSIEEWNYGHFEGLTKQQIKDEMNDQDWEVHKGCKGGETAKDVTKRLDKLIERIRREQTPYMNAKTPGDPKEPIDIFIIAHGLILRCFAMRWLGHTLDQDFPYTMEPAAVSVLTYRDNDIKKPALHLGLAVT